MRGLDNSHKNPHIRNLTQTHTQGRAMAVSDHHATHREVELLNTLRSFGGSARTAMLAETLNVSEETVRRTVKALARAGVVQRVHGGVYLANTEALAPVTTRIGKRTQAKAQIAAAATALIPARSSIFLDVGSTTAYVAEELRNHRAMTVVTNSLQAAQTLAGINDNRVFLACGQLQTVENGVFGTETIEYVARFNIDTAVISVDGFDDRSGFLLAGAHEAELARAVSRQAHRTLVVSDHTKFGQNAPMVACDPANVDVLVTDQAPGSAYQGLLDRWNIDVTVVPPTPTQ